MYHVRGFLLHETGLKDRQEVKRGAAVEQKAFVLIATYNERENIDQLVSALLSLPNHFEVLIVDDNSPDGTGERVAELKPCEPRLHLLSRKAKEGYGPAMIAGLKSALERGAERIITMDADFSHDPKDVPKLYAALEHSDIALGSRYSRGVRVLNWAPRRLLLSMGANRYVRTVLGLAIADCTSGFRGYRRQVFETDVLERCRFRGYAFLVELLYRCLKRGFAASEVEIIYTERREGHSKMSKRVIFEAVFAPWILKLSARKG